MNVGLILPSLAFALAVEAKPDTFEEKTCQRDATAAVAFVERNYAGYDDKIKSIGEREVRKAVNELRQRSAKTTDDKLCDQLIVKWLETFVDGHLSILLPRERREAAKTHESSSAKPSLELYGKTVALLKIPSFEPVFKQEIDALLNKSADKLRLVDNLVVDLRGNGGGSDSTFEGLWPWLLTEPVKVVGADVLATPDNAEAWERVVADVQQDTDDIRNLVAKMRSIASQMRAIPASTLMPLNSDREIVPQRLEALPRRVVLVVDKGCASSCEEFVLTARKSLKVLVIGTRTAGVLDYANVRPFPLPSGSGRVLLLPTSRTRRSASERVDGQGIQPTVVVEATQLSRLNDVELAKFSQIAAESHL